MTQVVFAQQQEDGLSLLGLKPTIDSPAVTKARAKLQRLKVPKHAGRMARAKVSVSRFAECLRAEEASDCILLAHPCVRIFQSMTHYNGGSLGELSCPVLLPSEMSIPQSLAIAEFVVGAETYFEWGAGSSTEMLAPLAERAYTAEHYGPWCDCLRSRPISRCLLNATSTEFRRRTSSEDKLWERQIACVPTKLNLRSFGRLQQNGVNNTHKNIADAHRHYVTSIDATRELAFDVILVDGRAHLSCALKALGYAAKNTVVFLNDYPKKYGKRLLRYYDLHRTIGWDGNECDAKQPGRCLAQLTPKPDFLGNHEVHADFLAQNKNFLRSPVNF